jgi:hypothetical protein
MSTSDTKPLIIQVFDSTRTVICIQEHPNFQGVIRGTRWDLGMLRECRKRAQTFAETASDTDCKVEKEHAVARARLYDAAIAMLTKYNGTSVDIL